MRGMRAGVLGVAAAVVLAGAGAAQAAPRQWDPLLPPTDVSALVAGMSDSILQVQCGDRLATGWSVEVSLSNDAKRQGYRSMIATDAEAMENCRSGGRRTVEIRYLGGEYTGYVWNWEIGQPFISVATKLRVPMLSWSGIPRPVVGQWVGLVSSEGGNGASFEDGRVQSVALRSVTTDMAPTAFRVGSPIFDSQGGVLGMVASRAGTVIEAGGPELCSSIVSCRNPSSIWVSFTIPRVIRSPEATALKGGLRVQWQAPLGADGAGPVDYYEYRVGQGAWKRTSRTAVVIKPLARGRAVTVEVRAVNFMGPGAGILVRGTPL